MNCKVSCKIKRKMLRTTSERLSEYKGQVRAVKTVNQQRQVHKVQSQLQTREEDLKDNGGTTK